MGEIKQYDFYYGAIINIILSKNPDATPTLVERTENRGIYKITTNISKDSIIFCKYASENLKINLILICIQKRKNR